MKISGKRLRLLIVSATALVVLAAAYYFFSYDFWIDRMFTNVVRIACEAPHSVWGFGEAVPEGIWSFYEYGISKPKRYFAFLIDKLYSDNTRAQKGALYMLNCFGVEGPHMTKHQRRAWADVHFEWYFKVVNLLRLHESRLIQLCRSQDKDVSKMAKVLCASRVLPRVKELLMVDAVNEALQPEERAYDIGWLTVYAEEPSVKEFLTRRMFFDVSGVVRIEAFKVLSGQYVPHGTPMKQAYDDIASYARVELGISTPSMEELEQQRDAEK